MTGMGMDLSVRYSPVPGHESNTIIVQMYYDILNLIAKDKMLEMVGGSSGVSIRTRCCGIWSILRR